MARIFPFRALHYSTAQISNLADVITPPYDVIPDGEKDKYLKRSPYNFAHVDLPHSVPDDYSRSAHLITKWREHGIIAQDNAPSYYLYRQDFTVDGRARTRDTLLCGVELRELSEGSVRPHENTFGKYKADRLQLMRATRCQLSPIFGMVKDKEGFLETAFERWEYGTPLLSTTDFDGVKHTVWRQEAGRAPEIAKFFDDKPVYILDGHHRYESALAYAKELRVVGDPEHPASQMLFAIANTYEPGLMIFPTHRIVRGAPAEGIDPRRLESSFEVRRMSPEELQEFVTRPHAAPNFALYTRGELYYLTPRHWNEEASRWGKAMKELAVSWSDHKLLGELCMITDENRSQKLTYERDFRLAWAAREGASMVIFHAPPTVEQVAHLADEKGFMPQKSTYFFPKLATGLVMRDISGGA